MQGVFRLNNLDGSDDYVSITALNWSLNASIFIRSGLCGSPHCLETNIHIQVV